MYSNRIYFAFTVLLKKKKQVRNAYMSCLLAIGHATGARLLWANKLIGWCHEATHFV